jgi:probable HAF family extracellular repeat protein
MGEVQLLGSLRAISRLEGRHTGIWFLLPVMAIALAPSVNAGPIAFLWTPNGGAQSLGTLGGDYSVAFGVNDRDQVVGISRNGDGDYRAFFWSSLTGMLDIGGAAGGYGTAYAINASGQVTGLLYEGAAYPQAFLWSLATGVQNLGPGAGRGINDLGQVVGSNTGDFLWTVNGGMQSIPITSADDINNLGQVAGLSNPNAVVWSATAGVQILPSLNGGVSHATASSARWWAIAVAAVFLAQHTP